MKLRTVPREGLAAFVLLALTVALLLTPATAAAPKPFVLPFSEPAGPATWYISQPYGNSVYAWYERERLYSSGQGMHMGLDLAAPCGSLVRAIGDGVVRSVDGRGGAPPHNLMIDHNNGFVSFYGHLRERPHVNAGQYVRHGEVVAYSGDMYSSCVDAPHLHLEIRDESIARFFNPVTLIDADWDSLLLFGAAPLSYERDLALPRRWQSLGDQPELRLGGPLLNDYQQAWPGGGS